MVKSNAEEVRQADVDLPNVATITTVDAVLTGLVGVHVGEIYLVWFDLAVLNAGLLYCGTAHATDDGELTVRLVNPTIAGINPAPGLEMTYLQL